MCVHLTLLLPIFMHTVVYPFGYCMVKMHLSMPASLVRMVYCVYVCNHVAPLFSLDIMYQPVVQLTDIILSPVGPT